MTDTLTLFTRPDCGLCELAAKMMEPLNITVHSVDITGQLDLLEAYGQRIPVLKFGRQELGWPFETSDIERLLGLHAE